MQTFYFGQYLKSMTLKVSALLGMFMIILILSFIPQTYAAEDQPISVQIDGKLQQFEQPPVIVNDRTLVPLRAIFEALGARIDWNSKTQTVTAANLKAKLRIVLTVGKESAEVNGESLTLDLKAQLINGRTMVPLRFVSQALGAKIDWVPATRTVLITTAKPTPNPIPMKPTLLPIATPVPTPASILNLVELSKMPLPKQETLVTLPMPRYTPKITKVFLTPRYTTNRDWETFNTNYFQIYYYTQAQEKDILIVSQYYDDLFESMRKKFGHPLATPIKVYFLNETDYLNERGVNSLTSAFWDLAEQTMVAKIDTTVDLEQQVDLFRHELTHAITLSSVHSISRNMPTWFMEAVATHYELAAPYYDFSRLSRMHQIFRDNKIISFKDIADDNTLWNKDIASNIYAQAQSFYGFLVETYGEEEINQLYYAPGDFYESIQEITDKTMNTLESDWKTYLAKKYKDDARTLGKLYVSSGDRYEGEMKNGVRDGQGKHFKAGKLEYSGQFKNGKFDGMGTIYMENGATYVGQVKDGQVTGQGILRWPSGSKYIGELKNGKQEGQGTFTWEDGESYVGLWKNGIQNGHGVITLANGQKYEGEFVDGVMN